MKLSHSDQYWLEQALAPITRLAVPEGSDDTDVVATIWSNRRLADDRLQHSVTARDVKNAKRVYKMVTALMPDTPKGAVE